MGTVTVPDASTLMITPFDKTSLRDIERAIQESDIGINPNNDGERIRLIMPPMTQVRRRVEARVWWRSCGTEEPGGKCPGPSARLWNSVCI